MIGPYSPPVAELTDRVDVLRASQAVQGGAVLPLDECVAAFDVPCRIIELSASRTTTLLGDLQQVLCTAEMLDEPAIEANDVLRVVDSRLPQGRRQKYVVKTVRSFPSPHDRQRQVCDLTPDLGGLG